MNPAFVGDLVACAEWAADGVFLYTQPVAASSTIDIRTVATKCGYFRPGEVAVVIEARDRGINGNERRIVTSTGVAGWVNVLCLRLVQRAPRSW